MNSEHMNIHMKHEQRAQHIVVNQLYPLLRGKPDGFRLRNKDLTNILTQGPAWNTPQ